MDNFELETIYTNYALELMQNSLKIYEGSESNIPFTFSKVIISPKIVEKAEDIEDIGAGYSIKDLTVDLKNRVSSKLKEVVITGDIEDSVNGIRLGSMGLYVTDSSNQEHLFAVMVGNGYDIKPSDIGYNLVIKVKYSLQDDNIISSRFPEIYVIIKDKVSTTDVNKAMVRLISEVENIERCIDYNSTKEGYNLSQVQYLRQQKINRNVLEYSNTLKLSYMVNRVNMNKCKNIFFPMDLTSLDDYTVTNYVIDDLWKEGSELLVESQTDTFRSDGDEITFNQPFTLSMFLNVNNINNNFILCKADTIDNDFTKWYMRFYIEGTKDMPCSLVFQIYGNKGSIINTYDLTSRNVFDLSNYYVNIVYTFNGDDITPITQLFWNGEITNSSQEIIEGFDYVADGTSGRLMNYEVYGGNNFNYSENVILGNIMFFNDVIETRDIIYLSKINGVSTLPIIEF